MFEEELELEKKESSILPLLLIVGFVAAILGVAGYFYKESRRVLTNEEATALANAVLKAQAAPVVHFHTGQVDDNTADPHYRLLEKAGLIKIGKLQKSKTPVNLTPKGEELLASIPDVKKEAKETSTAYSVPLATRKFISVTEITKQSPTKATFTYTWNWEPNRLGDIFDANGPIVQGFNTWDRSVLIDKYGVNFYHGDTRSNTLRANRDENKWGIATD
jgi:predicted transcriptional regulator